MVKETEENGRLFDASSLKLPVSEGYIELDVSKPDDKEMDDLLNAIARNEQKRKEAAIAVKSNTAELCRRSQGKGVLGSKYMLERKQSTGSPGTVVTEEMVGTMINERQPTITNRVKERK